jgi:hypothetical protein
LKVELADEDGHEKSGRTPSGQLEGDKEEKIRTPGLVMLGLTPSSILRAGEEALAR